MAKDGNTFSLDSYVDKEFELSNIDKMEDNELFEKGFTSYIYPESTFLDLRMEFRVTTKCPINQSEDIIKIKLKYTVGVRGMLIEHHSFLRWIDTFKEKGMGLEATCETIYKRIMEIVKPTNLKVVAKSHSNYASVNKAVRKSDW